MKKIVLTLGFVVALALVCLFEVPASQSQSGKAAAPTVPPYCHPCLWYGGDFDPSNPASGGSEDEDTIQQQATTYVAFYVPTGQVWTVTGLFSNVLSNLESAAASKQIQWSISKGMSSGNPGTVIASGTVGAGVTATGRTWQGYTEYSALGRLPRAQYVTLNPGVYWMTAVPMCTTVGNGFCLQAFYFLSDVEDTPAPNRRGFQPNDDAFFNASGYYYVPTWGPTGECGGGCDRFSAGLLGHAAAQ